MRLDDEGRRELLRQFAALGILRDTREMSADELSAPWARRHGLVCAIEGTHSFGERDVRFRVGVCDRFPIVLPHIVVADRAAMPFMPHLEHDGRICFLVEEGLVLRASDPNAVLTRAVRTALETVEKGLSGENAKDVYDELDRYWLDATTLPKATAAWIDSNRILRPIRVAFERARRQSEPTFRYAAETFADVHAWDPGIERAKKEKVGLYVPLEASVLDEPINPASFDAAAWVRDFVARHLSSENKERLGDVLARTTIWPFVVLGIPRAKHAGRTLVGLHYVQVHGGHPLATGTTSHRVRKVVLRRYDAAVLHERGGAMTRLRSMKVLVVGCGAVGGHVAMNLATSGIGKIVLVDSDTLKPENTFRHVLGKAAVDLNKAVALRTEIRRRFPYVEVEDVKGDVLRAKIDWGEYHLVIATTGNITLSRWLNEELAKADTAAVFTWLEPLGIGGHALLTHVRGPGCYECLFRDPKGNELLENAADFAAPGQDFTRDLAGCTSTFTPYGALDAVRTAELATRIALSALTGENIEHAMRSWKGPSDAFEKNDKQTSRRYALDEIELHEKRLAYVCSTCPICSVRP